MRCYAKHLSKALVEASEYFEADGRESEFALCIGDIACAEDHARSLGLEAERSTLRGVRNMMWDGRKEAMGVLGDMAASAVRMAVSETRSQPDVPEGGPDGASNG